jgi:hypothetical protein
MNRRLLSGMGLLTIALGLAAGPQAYGEVYSLPPIGKTPEAATQYQRPEDILIAKVPLLAALPSTFLLGDGFKVKLGVSDLRIDHMGSHSRSPMAKRNCMVGISYLTPVAGFFTSRVDLPLFASPDLHLSDWSHTSLGDYVAYFSRGAVDQPSLRLVLSAKF